MKGFNIPFGLSFSSVVLITNAIPAFVGRTWEPFLECAVQESMSQRKNLKEPGMTIFSALIHALPTGV